MKKIIFLLITLITLSSVLALDIDIQKKSSNEVFIVGIDKPAVFNFEITNRGPTVSIEFYNFLSFDMSPKGSIPLNIGKNNIHLEVKPIGEPQQRGFYNFQYFIKGDDGSQIERKLLIKITDLKDAFEIGSTEIDPESNEIKIYIHNKENFNFEEINAKFSSPFFDIAENFSLESYKRKDFTIKLNKEDFAKLMAGFYTLKAEVVVEDQTANIEGMIRFVEKDLMDTTKTSYGFIIHTDVIKKTNSGNIVSRAENKITKNIISRLFTTLTPEPDIVERKGLIIEYTWNREVNPGETLEMNITTNWTFPLLIIAFIVVIVILVKMYTRTNLVLRKKVHFVNAKGGEFALKVSIFVSARKYIQKVTIMDRLPPLVRIYERFGGEQPSRVDEKTKRIKWNFNKLEEGETRVLSYIIYSKVGVVGKFALPPATALYEREGKMEETTSNNAFFIAEQSKEEE